MKYGIAILFLAGLVAADGHEGEKRKHDDAHRLTAALKGLGQGIEALQALGHHEEAEHLAEIARDVKRKLGALKERYAAREELAVLRIAFHGCREAEKRKWMDLLEHAIHARELRLAGRRDEEAQRVYSSEPPRGAVAELLLASGDIWAKFGHEEKAAQCYKLGKRYAQHARKARSKERERAKGEREGRDEVVHALKRALARIEQLEERIAHLERRLARER